MTKYQYKIYDIVRNYIKERGYSPTIREVCKVANKNVATVQMHLKKLRDLGFITYEDRKSRTIKLIKDVKYYYE